MTTVILIPIISALIGWLTNWIAIKMLFYPREPKNFLGIKIQGIFPKKQKDLAVKIGKIVAEQLLSGKEISDKIFNKDKINEFNDKIEIVMNKFMGDYFNRDFKRGFPFFSIFITDKLRSEIKYDVMKRWKQKMPNFMDESLVQIKSDITNDINVEKIISDKITAMPVEQVEDIMLGILKDEFRFIEILGGVIGFLIGLIQVIIIK